VMIFTSNYSSQQPWLHPPWTDKIFVKKPWNPPIVQKTNENPVPITLPRTLL
jgi:hypothetical protein